MAESAKRPARPRGVPLWLKIVGGILGLCLFVVAYIFLGWLVAIAVPILVWTNLFGVRSRIVDRLPALGTIAPGLVALALLVVLGGVWGVLVASIARNAPPSTPTPPPTAIVMVAPTVTAAPTPLPTDTPLPTYTPIPPTTTPTLTPTPLPPTDTPTITPSPTITPTPLPPTPTDTPTKTATPLPPTATPKPPMPQAVKDYIAYLAQWTNTAQSGINGMNDRLTEYSADPTLLLDQNWQVKMGYSLGLMQVAGEKYQQYPNVPPECKALNTAVVSLGKDLVYIAQQIAAGIDNLNATNLNNAATRLNGIPSKSQAVTNELNKLKDRYSVGSY